MATRKKQKAYTQMTAEELAAATAEFDREVLEDNSRPLTPADRKRWERAKRKRGRPRKGAGVKVGSVSVEEGLLDQSDALARKLGVSRAALVARGLRAVLAASGEGCPAFAAAPRSRVPPNAGVHVEVVTGGTCPRPALRDCRAGWRECA